MTSPTDFFPPAPRFSLPRAARAGRRIQAALGRVLAGVLLLVLGVVPPGGAVCWPLLDGWHVHIGWSDAIGRPTPGLVVYSHRGPERVINPHRTGFSALGAPDTVNLSDLRPLAAGAQWLIPVLALVWLCLPDFTRQRQPQPSPLEQPPNQWFAAYGGSRCNVRLCKGVQLNAPTAADRPRRTSFREPL